MLIVDQPMRWIAKECKVLVVIDEQAIAGCSDRKGKS